MNREILFKAKRKDNGEWESGSLKILPTGECEIMHRVINPPDCDPIWKRGVVTCDVNPDTVCQSTGGLDHYHNKIWENDICKVNTQNVDEEDGYFVVEWDAETLRFVLSGNGLMIDFNNLGTGQVEVVGNIFDNADLLEE